MRRRMLMIALAVLALCTTWPAWADVSADVVEMGRLQRWDDIIARMDKEIAASPNPDPSLLYLWGRAACAVWRMDVAEADLSKIGDYAPSANWIPASAILAQVRKIEALTPPTELDLKIDGAVAYRVHWDGTSDWGRAAIAMLPEAYRTVCGFYGVNLAETSVLIFTTRAQYSAYCQGAEGRQPHSWEWASGGTGRILLCQERSDGQPDAVPGTDYFRAAFAHEMTHCLLRRYLGTTEFPQWLNEGLAMLSGSFLGPSDTRRNDQNMADILARNAVVPLATLTTRELFLREENERDAYVQAFSMVRFVYAQVGQDGIVKLIQLLKSEGSLDAALKKGWDSDQQKLYNLWLTTVTARPRRR
jgi:hypothetical protein